MKAQIIKIGNSKGIRIPKSILEQTGLGPEVNIEVRNGELIISPFVKMRENWAEAFNSMHDNKDDSLIDVNLSSVRNKWDSDEWEW